MCQNLSARFTTAIITPFIPSTTSSPQVFHHPTRKSRFLILFLFLATAAHLLSLCEGSHYIKYQMSDYCDPGHRLPPIELQPNGNRTAILIKLKREAYRSGMDCTITVRAPPNYGLMAFITKLKLRRISATKADRLEFLSPTAAGSSSGQNLTLLRMHGLNQEVMPRKTILTGFVANQLDIHFVSEVSSKTLAGKGFKVVVNLYSNVLKNNECESNLGLDFNCGNDICVDSFLECDGTNNCRNNEDELECDETSETKFSLYVFLATLLVMVVLVMMFMMKNKEKRKEIVRRMSRVYANNNPILYVMEKDDSVASTGDDDLTTASRTSASSGSASDSLATDSRISSPPLPLQSRSGVSGMEEGRQQQPTEAKKTATSAFREGNRVGSVRSHLSFSLPQGMDQIHNKV